MKARLLLLLLLPICIGTSAVGYAQEQSQKMTPEAFNEELVKVTTTLYLLGTEWGTKFASVSSGDKDFSQLSTSRERLSDFINTRIDSVKLLPEVGKGADGFKKAMLNFLTFEAEMLNTGFIPLEKLGKNATNAEIQKATQRLSDLSSKEGEALEKVNQAQDKYAKANGIVLDGAQ